MFKVRPWSKTVTVFIAEVISLAFYDGKNFKVKKL